VRAWKIELLNGSEQSQSLSSPNEDKDLDAFFGTGNEEYPF